MNVQIKDHVPCTSIDVSIGYKLIGVRLRKYSSLLIQWRPISICIFRHSFRNREFLAEVVLKKEETVKRSATLQPSMKTLVVFILAQVSPERWLKRSRESPQETSRRFSLEKIEAIFPGTTFARGGGPEKARSHQGHEKGSCPLRSHDRWHADIGSNRIKSREGRHLAQEKAIHSCCVLFHPRSFRGRERV